VYAKGDSYASVFGVWLDPDMTFGEAVALKGNSFNSFVRHSMAALLNTSHPDVACDMTPGQIIAIV
jgi:hypothetical protein